MNLIESQGCLGYVDGTITPLAPKVVVQLPNATEQMVTYPEFNDWIRTDKLIKGWIISTLREEILRQVVGLKTAADVGRVLKNMFNKATMDRELTLHHQLQVLRRENCALLTDYLSQYKTICDELAAIGKPLPEDRKPSWMLNGLGSIRCFPP